MSLKELSEFSPNSLKVGLTYLPQTARLINTMGGLKAVDVELQ
jgi:hypothetical protein